MESDVRLNNIISPVPALVLRKAAKKTVYNLHTISDFPDTRAMVLWFTFLLYLI